MTTYPRIAQLKTPEAFSGHIRDLGIDLGFDPEVQTGPGSPLAQPYQLPNHDIPLSNRFCVLPMEGWDGTTDGRATELVYRRWRRFGESGAKLIWGGEAVAVLPEARANPNQLIINQDTVADLAQLRETLVQAHAVRWDTRGLYTGLQLTHSGRFCRPTARGMEPRILYPHPLLNPKFGLAEDYPLLEDGEIGAIIEATIQAAVLAQKAGFDFVDIKHCHGYLGHEFLSAVDRPGRYGGSFENRTRYLREITAGVRAAAPGLEIGVRFSAFDFIPFQPGGDGAGEPVQCTQGREYPYAFGGDGSGTGIDLREPHQFLDLLESLDIKLVNVTAGSPY